MAELFGVMDDQTQPQGSGTAMKREHVIMVAGVFGLLAVAAGAFGAHLLEDRLSPRMLDVFETAARYQMYHALALLACAAVIDQLGKAGRFAVWCFVAGVVVFSGTLYGLSLGGPRWLGAVTPLGGLLLMSGWLSLVIGGWFAKKRSQKHAT